MRSLLAALLGVASVLAGDSIIWNFEGGRLERVERVSERHWRAHVAGEADQDGRNRQANWYLFRVDLDSAGGTPVVIDIVNLPGEYNYKPNRGAVTGDTPPVISFDNRTWAHVDNFEYDGSEPRLRIRITPKSMRFWIAHVPPYTNQHLAALRKWAGAHIREERIGKTVEGRDLVLWTIGDGPKVAWLFFRQHSWESGSSWVGEGLVRHLVSDTGAGLRKQVTWKIFPLCDPDGVARGGVRFNKFGYDLNRNWDVSDAAKMPEIRAQRSAIAKWLASGRGIDFAFSLHNTETSEYLEGPPENGGGGKYVALAERLFAALERATTFAPTRPLFYSDSSTTTGMPGRMNVVQGLYRDFKLPAFLMEQRISMQPKYERRPLVEDRLRFGRELAAAIARSLEQPH